MSRSISRGGSTLRVSEHAGPCQTASHEGTIIATQYSSKSQLCCPLAWLVALRNLNRSLVSATTEVNLQLGTVLRRCSFFCYGYFSGSRVDTCQAALATTLGYWLQPSHAGCRKAETVDTWGRHSWGELSTVKGVCTMVAEPRRPLFTNRAHLTWAESPGVIAARPLGFGGEQSPAERSFPCAPLVPSASSSNFSF